MAKKSKKSYAWSILVIFLIVGWIYPPVGVIALVCMLAPVIVALATGKRKWCAMFCPRGMFNDVILSKISRGKKAPAILTSTYFKTGFLIFLMANLVVGIINAGGNIGAIGMVFVRLVSLTTAMAIVLGYIYTQRTWCGFCPMGFLATLSIKLKKYLSYSRKAAKDTAGPESGVTLYTGENCPACDRVKEQLNNLNVSYRETNIDKNKQAKETMVDKHGTINIPSLSIDGKFEKDTSPEKLKELLRANKAS